MPPLYPVLCETLFDTGCCLTLCLYLQQEVWKFVPDEVARALFFSGNSNDSFGWTTQSQWRDPVYRGPCFTWHDLGEVSAQPSSARANPLHRRTKSKGNKRSLRGPDRCGSAYSVDRNHPQGHAGPGTG